MNKIVKEHYPVTKLPAELRPAALKGNTVTVTVVEEAAERKPLSRHEAVALMRRMQRENRGRGVSVEGAVARIRALRDEWDDP